MTAIEQISRQLEALSESDAPRDGWGLVDVLRLFGSGATGSIMLALGEGPLRTKELTARVPGYTPRTVYRYVRKLVEIGAIDREEEPGVPSKVIHSLTDPRGVQLYELIDGFARASLELLPDGGVVPHSWGSLTLLADLWESGMLGKLNASPCTATELAQVDHQWSFHQVSRRTGLLLIGGLLREAQDGRRRRRYELTDAARRGTAMIAGLGHWRQRHAVPAEEQGLTAMETAELLRTTLPLVALPEHTGKSLELGVFSPEQGHGDTGELVWAEVGGDGTVTSRTGPLKKVDGWARGEAKDWIDVLIQGTGKGIRVGGGDGAAVRICLREMHAALWRRVGVEDGGS